RLLQQLRVVIFLRDVSLQQNVRVRIHKAGQHRRGGQIDQVYAGGIRPARRDADDLVPFNEDQRIYDGRIALAVDQAPGAKGNFLRSGRGLVLRAAKRNRQNRNDKKTSDRSHEGTLQGAATIAELEGRRKV